LAAVDVEPDVEGGADEGAADLPAFLAEEAQGTEPVVEAAE
jgi:hypothetical protein